MQGVSRKTALGALLGVVLAAVAILLLSGDDSSPDAPHAASGQGLPQAAKEARPRETRAERRRLVIPDRGHPIVWVRHGHTVGIHSSPGGPVVRRVGDETEFGSTRVFAVERTDAASGGDGDAHPTTTAAVPNSPRHRSMDE